MIVLADCRVYCTHNRVEVNFMIVLTECQYFPSVILFKKVIDFSNVEFDIYDVYRKMSFRNRCVIAGGGGPVNLSIPLVEGRNQRRPLKEVRIDNKTGWQGQHWKTITSCYNRSPWFEFYKHDLEILYRQPADWLHEWNRKCWDWVVGKLGLEIQTRWSEGPVNLGQGRIPGGSAGDVGSSSKDQVGIPSDAVGGKNDAGGTIAEAAGNDTVEVTGFEPVSEQDLERLSTKVAEAGVEHPDTNDIVPRTGVEPGDPATENSNYLDWKNKLLPKTLATEFPEPIRYRQVFEDRIGFLPHLSILDLLFCEGPRTVEILISSKIPI